MFDFYRKASIYSILRISLLFALFVSLSAMKLTSAETLKGSELENKHEAKESNISEAQRLNNTTPPPSDASIEKKAKETANVVNQVPGVKVSHEDLMPPSQPPIKGFHPIKRLLRPVENLEGMSIKLEQQIMKLEGPIAALQPAMLNLHKKMTTVDDQLGNMQVQLSSVESEVKGTRADLAAIRKDISALREPISALRGPIGSVAKPLEAVQVQLNLVLLAILLTAFTVALGTPIAAIVLYRYRHKIFPNLGEH